MVKIVVVLVPLILSVAYFTYWERKILAWMHVRVGPNRVGWKGLLQPFADVIKMLLKEIVLPTKANKVLFLLAPCLALVPALAVWAVVPMNDTFVIANIDAGLLYVLALTSAGVYGVILAGWSSNSKYAFLGAMRSAAQIVAYEIAMGFALVGVLMAGGSLNLGEIMLAQQGYGFCHWFVIGRCFRCSSCTSSRASRRRTARRSTWRKANRRSWPASTSNIPVSRSACSSWPSTRT